MDVGARGVFDVAFCRHTRGSNIPPGLESVSLITSFEHCERATQGGVQRGGLQEGVGRTGMTLLGFIDRGEKGRCGKEDGGGWLWEKR